jgi:hypothetical protein
MMNKIKVEGAIEQACSRDGTAIAIARYLCVWRVRVSLHQRLTGKRHSTLVPLQFATSPLPLSNWLEKIWVERRRRKSWSEALVPVSIRTLGGRTNAELDSSASENGRRTVSRFRGQESLPRFHSAPFWPSVLRIAPPIQEAVCWVDRCRLKPIAAHLQLERTVGTLDQVPKSGLIDRVAGCLIGILAPSVLFLRKM